ncbi:MAG: 4Fe-4S binding protein, partial [Candidatus Izimaplasma sp.]|nr:4Fe-4S binding protein [Candidatus Izimaplasma bacterium]
APDLNILITGETTEEHDFVGFQRPIINYDNCDKCGLCAVSCNFGAISDDIVINPSLCEGCKVCEYVCPANTITMHDAVVGKIFKRKTIFGTMIDARLTPGEESSGKLVAEVRKLAREAAYAENKNTIIIDGSPGIACNVISAITGVSKAIIVTEPTVSGLHDLKKVIHLIRIFSVEAKVIINKYDLSLGKAKEIKEYLELMEIEVVLELPFDVEVVNSISNLQIPSTTNIAFFSSKKWFDFIEYLRN